MKLRLFVLVLMAFMLVEFMYAATLHGALYDSDFNLMENVQVYVNTTPKQNHVSKNGLYFFNVPPGTYMITAERFYQKKLAYSAESLIVIDKDGEFKIDIILKQIPGVDIPQKDEINGPSLFTILRAKYGYLFYGGLLMIVVLFVSLVFFSATLIFNKIREKRDGGQGSKADDENQAEPKHIEHIETSTSYSMNMHQESEPLKEEKIEKEKEQQVSRDEDQLSGTEGILKFMKDEGGRITQKDIRKKFPVSEAKVSLMISELEAKGKIEKIKKGRGNIIILKE